MRSIDQLVRDIELIKSKTCKSKGIVVCEKSTSSSVPLLPHGLSTPPHITGEILHAFDEFDEEPEPPEEESLRVDSLHSAIEKKRKDISNAFCQDSLSRKRRKYTIHFDNIGVTKVQVNSNSWKNFVNPYLTMSSNDQDIQTSFNGSSPAVSGYSDQTKPQNAPRECISPLSLLDKGFVKVYQDPNLYLPFTVTLAPVTHSPKLKKHHVVRLMEPDIGITSTTSFRGLPNSFSPLSSYDSTTIDEIPSILIPTIAPANSRPPKSHASESKFT